MANYEFSRYITIGRHFPGKSFIHQMDARVKLVCFMVWLLWLSLLPSVTVEAALTLCIIALFGLARMSLAYALSGIRPLIPVLIVILLFELLFARSAQHAHILLVLGPIRVTESGVVLAAISILRFLGIVWLVSLFTMTTTMSNMTYGLRYLLRPLEKLRVPVTDIVMMITLAFRFVPIFAEEAERIVKAQAARGADFGTLKWWQIGRRIRGVLPVLVPVFLAAMDRTEHVATAMEVRGYRPGASRSSYVQFVSSRWDMVSLALTLLMACAASWAAWGIHVL